MDILELIAQNEKFAPLPTEAFLKFSVKIQEGRLNGLLWQQNKKDADGKRPKPFLNPNICNFEVGDIFIKPSSDYEDSISLELFMFSPDNSQKSKIVLDFGAASSLDTQKYSFELDLLWKLCNLKGKRIKSLSIKTGGTFEASGTDKAGKKYKTKAFNLLSNLVLKAGYVPKTEDWYIKKDKAAGTPAQVLTLGIFGKPAELFDDALKFVEYWKANFNDTVSVSYDPELDQRDNIDFETGEVTKIYDVEATDVNADGLPF